MFSTRILLADKPFSSHPGDYYLRLQMFQLPDNEITPYCTHILNTDLGGHHEGHYCRSLTEALSSFNERGRP